MFTGYQYVVIQVGDPDVLALERRQFTKVANVVVQQPASSGWPAARRQAAIGRILRGQLCRNYLRMCCGILRPYKTSCSVVALQELQARAGRYAQGASAEWSPRPPLPLPTCMGYPYRRPTSCLPASRERWRPLETIDIAIFGTLAGLILAIPLAVLAASNVTPSRYVYYAARGVIAFTRAVPDLVWENSLSAAVATASGRGSSARFACRACQLCRMQRALPGLLNACVAAAVGRLGTPIRKRAPRAAPAGRRT